MYFFDMFYHVATSRFTSFTPVFHKKRKGQEVQKSASKNRVKILRFFLLSNDYDHHYVQKIFLSLISFFSLYP